MDILRKMFRANEPKSQTEDAQKDDGLTGKDEFRKPQWFEEAETDDELFDDDRKFAFQIFTNPMEMQKHFEHQMQQMLKNMGEFEDSATVEKNLREEFLKPGFEEKVMKEFEKHKKHFDTDLDGEIYADQLHTLMQDATPSAELPNILPSNDKTKRHLIVKPKLSDEEQIMCRIHGTLNDEEPMVRPRAPQTHSDILTPMTPRIRTPFGGVFEGTYPGPKMFSQSVIIKTVRKPDGSYETTKVTRDPQGNKTTTVTRNKDGKTESFTTYDGTDAHTEQSGSSNSNDNKNKNSKGIRETQTYSNRNIYVTNQGYAVPRNLW